ncbi:MAG: endolytic transglycosylase MltG [Nitrospiraceae bacterium]|nr:endolytic transglycosylase MltG [Nitrospiraceae bacterium]
MSSPNQQKPGIFKRWVRNHLWTTFILAALLVILIVHFYIALFVPPSRDKAWKEIEVTDGMSFKAIAAKLQQEGIIRYRGYFEIIGRLQGISRKVRTGYYGLGSHMSLWEVLDALRSGKIIEYEVVIPEGYNLFQIGYTLAQTPLLDDPNKFINMVTNKKFVQSLGFAGDSLEGYLFPDTYYLPKGITVQDIAKRMVSRYRAVYTEDYQKRAEELGMNEHQVITLASIVEKEAKVPTERKLVAAVYHNRLKKGMRLQADPTAVYGKKAWITNVTSADLKRKTPYNTYLHKGLPPGPIANPGQSAILATLYPEQVDYLFFVAQGDGSHHFSADFGEHEKAIGRYRANKRKAKLQAAKQTKPKRLQEESED